MDEEEEPRPGRRWLPWIVIAAGAAAGLWLAAAPLDQLVPEAHPRRSLTPDPLDAVAPEPGATALPEAGASTPAERPIAAPVPAEEAIDPTATTPAAEWVEEGPDELAEEPASAQALRDRLERQLAMNDLAGVRIEIVGDRVITSGALARASDRQRVALLIRSLAPDLVHEDHAEVAGEAR